MTEKIDLSLEKSSVEFLIELLKDHSIILSAAPNADISPFAKSALRAALRAGEAISECLVVHLEAQTLSMVAEPAQERESSHRPWHKSEDEVLTGLKHLTGRKRWNEIQKQLPLLSPGSKPRTRQAIKARWARLVQMETTAAAEGPEEKFTGAPVVGQQFADAFTGAPILATKVPWEPIRQPSERDLMGRR